jgi:hypothetical protein
MSALLSRRHFMASTPALCVAPVLLPGIVLSQDTYAGGASGPVHPKFPTQDPVRVKEMVGASHSRIERLKSPCARASSAYTKL